jgi:hypothetical protein
VQQLANRPNMVSNARRHCRGLPATVNVWKAVMGRTEVGDRTCQVHPTGNGCEAAGRATGSAVQHSQARAESSIQALDVVVLST